MKTNQRKTNWYENTKSVIALNHKSFKNFCGLTALTTYCCLLLPTLSFAQNVGISSTGATPDNSAMLDVLSNTKGMLIPRMTGAEKYAITTPATGLLIFQTDTVGFWYYDGTKWIPLLSSTSSTASPSNAGWLTTGNSGTTWDKNFLGTTDNVSLRLRTNDTERMIVDSLGRVGIGTTSPTRNLHIYSTDNTNTGINLDAQGSGTSQQSSISFITKGDGTASLGNASTLGWSFYARGNAWNSPTSEQNDMGLSYWNGTNWKLRMCWDTSGNVGIGTTNNSYKLSVNTATSQSNDGVQIFGSDNHRAEIYPSKCQGCANPLVQAGDIGFIFSDGLIGTGNLVIAPWSPSSYGIRMTSTGNVGINCSSPQYPLHVSGNIGVVGTIYATAASVTSGVSACSDIRYKKDITPLSHALDKVLSMQGVNYYWKTKEFPEKQFTADNQIGFIAQELEKIVPEVVMTDKDGYKSVDYSRLTPVLVEAIKEQQKTIGSMQLAIDKLKAENESSEWRIAKLETAMQKLTQSANTEETRK